MGQSPLLPLNAVDEAFVGTKDLTFSEKLHEFVVLQVKDPGDNVILVRGHLALEEFILDLFPMRVAGKCQKEIRGAIHSDICHGILLFLIVPPWRGGEA